jgi:helicase
LKVNELDIPTSLKQVLLKNGYDNLYPPQEDAINAGVLKGKNLVLASPTASGKTLIAELCVIKNILTKGGKALYLTPLRALASEKYEDFRKYSGLAKPDGEKVKVAISTGEYDRSDQWLSRYDVIFATNEKADSLLRHRTGWIRDISTVVADEVHLLNEADRGPTLEVVLTRLMHINPKIQFLALSATIRNAEEVAEWLKAVPITTEWRPVPLREGVYCNGEIQFKDGSARTIPAVCGDSILDIALEIVGSGGQVLIFAETRKSSVQMGKKTSIVLKGRISKQEDKGLKLLAKKLLETGEKTRLSEILAEQIQFGAGFHHAGLPTAHRRLVEDAFRKGHIKILSATPTLAAGVNLPARTVVVSSYMRYEPGYGRYPISVLEYKQLCGRAGRPKYDKFGEAVLVAISGDEQDQLMQNYVLAEPENLWSKLAVEKILRPHVLATIATGYAHTENGLYEFFGKTFYAFQYDPKMIQTKIGDILAYLCKEGMTEFEGARIQATDFGRRVSELYIDPVTAVIMRDGLQSKPKEMTDLTFLHLISHTPDIAPKLYPRRRESEELEVFAAAHSVELMFPIPDLLMEQVEYEEFLAELKSSAVLMDWIDEATEDRILDRYKVEPGDLLRLVEMADWLLYSAHELAGLFGQKEFLPYLTQLRLRVQTGVKKELVPLVRLRGIGRVRARTLYSAGYKTINDLRKASVSELMKIPLIGSALSKKIKEEVGGTITAEEWRVLKDTKEDSEEQRLLSEY